MKINRVFANKPSFKRVEFDSLFAVVLADITSDSSDKDTRNGLGKSLLVDIISYCLGSGLPEKLKKEELKKWAFGLEVEIEGKVYIFERQIENSSKIKIEGDVTEWPVETTSDSFNTFKVEEFNLVMGQIIFKVPTGGKEDKQYQPRFRRLISYFMRTDKTAFNSPFKHMTAQPAWSAQVNNAYLLGLNWQYAAKLQTLRSKEEALKNIQGAATAGVLKDFTGSVGELESERVRVTSKLEIMEQRLAEFKVHEQYYEIQKEADGLTDKIHSFLNSINLNQQTINQYKTNLTQEKDISSDDVEALYEEVGINFPDQLKQQLDSVQHFHEEVVKNRKTYLDEEIDHLNRLITESKKEVSTLSGKREQLMAVLQSHGALDEHSQLQKLASVEEQKLEDITTRIQRLNDFADSMSLLRVELEELIRAMRQDHQERRQVVDNAIRIFNANSESLYSKPGVLSIDVVNTGYKFKVDIQRAESDGVENMKIFCYDLMLAELWATKGQPIPLIHDSRLFDGVDGRQVAKALELAYTKSKELGFQYICTMNSDAVPSEWFTNDFQKVFDESIKVILNDKEESGTLLGFRL